MPLNTAKTTPQQKSSFDEPEFILGPLAHLASAPKGWPLFIGVGELKLGPLRTQPASFTHGSALVDSSPPLRGFTTCKIAFEGFGVFIPSKDFSSRSSTNRTPKKARAHTWHTRPPV